MIFSGKVQFLGLIAFAVVLCAADLAMAQGRGGRGGGGFGGTSVLDLALNEEVAEREEINEDQTADLKALAGDRDEKRREAFMGIREEMGKPGADRGAIFGNLRDEMAIIDKGIEKDMEDILLAHQMSNIRKIHLQQQLRRNPQGGLEAVLKKIGAESKIDAVKEALEKNQKEYLAKVEKLRVQTLDKSLKEALSSSEVKEFYETVGLEPGGSGGVELSREGFRGGAWGQQRGGGRGGDRGGDRGERGDRGGDRGDRGDRGGRGGDRGSDFS